jgi:Mlc titration factor MtfA (ptsG expression regulator)
VFWFLLLILSMVLWFTVPPRLRRLRRARLFAEPFPQNYVEILDRNVPLYRRIPPDLQRQLKGRINVFLNEKVFAGCGGFEINDEVKVTIAAHACFLILNRDTNYFPGFSTILVYPDTYLVNEVVYDGEIATEGQDARSGESWHLGPVILSWQDVQESLADSSYGYNVVMHEFAHKLDEENGDVDGVPALADSSHYREWAEVLARAYGASGHTGSSGRNQVLDEYAYTAPEEFFAVATETFFEKPEQMKGEFPELYAQLARFYCVDPAGWLRR